MPADTFNFSTIASPQYVAAPFPVTLKATDATGAVAASFTGTVQLSAVTDLPVGTGTVHWQYPMATNYHDARTQVIYLASQIGRAATLTGLSLYVGARPGQTMNTWTIRMRHTTLASYPTSSPIWESTGWTTVYQANTTLSSSRWVTFTFTTPFAYNGTDNLMIDFSFNNTSYTSDGLCDATNTGARRSLYYRTDSGYGDPRTWSGSSDPTPNVSTYIPNIRLNTSDSVAISPTVTGNLVAGVWTGQVSVLSACAAIRLRASATGDASHWTDSNSFRVDTPVPTMLPVVPTACPVVNTTCPPNVTTVCPVVNTTCPPNVTTVCPVVNTTCPPSATACPVNPTFCPPESTKCPANPTV
jgi:hypothetical protein